ncbi:MAG: glycosyltransferase family 39 protein [Acidobacteriota bacterium]
MGSPNLLQKAGGILSSRCLLVIFLLALGLRLAGLDWGIPVYDQATAIATPGLRVSYHLDEDNLLQHLVGTRPAELDFYAPDFHWGTLQYHLITLMLWAAEQVGWISSPWQDAFRDFNPVEYPRLFVAGRLISAVLGSLTVFPVFFIGRQLHGEGAARLGSLALAAMPLHVVSSHYLTPDVAMTFLVLLSMERLLRWETRSQTGFRSGGLALQAGGLWGLAMSAKYNALFLLPAVLSALLKQPRNRLRHGMVLTTGVCLGFFLGEPYSITHWDEFREAIHRNLQAPSPDSTFFGAELLAAQLKNVLLFGFGPPLGLLLLVIWQSRRRSETAARPRSPFSGGAETTLWIAMASFFLTLPLLKFAMLRYCLPLVALSCVPLGKVMAQDSRRATSRWLVGIFLLLTGALSLLQVKILLQEHPANAAFRWILRHVPSGTCVAKGWPTIPILSGHKYELAPLYGEDGFSDLWNLCRNGLPDYVILDNLTTLVPSERFQSQLRMNYRPAMTFSNPPGLGTVRLPEWSAPHDWKYSHPTLILYQRKPTAGFPF